MLRRFIVAVAAVAALGIGATDASAAWHGHGGGYHGGYHGGYRGGYGGYGWGGVGAGLVAGALVGSASQLPTIMVPAPTATLSAPGAAYYVPRYRILLTTVAVRHEPRRRPVITFPAPIID